MDTQINKLFRTAGSALKSFNDGIKGIVSSSIEVDEVIQILNNTTIKKSQYTTEKNIENILSKSLDIAFGVVHRQYSIGGFLALKVDIDLGDGQVGLEIKLAKDLSTTGIERLFGQVLYYSKRTYKEKLIVVIVGTAKEYNQVIKEVEAIIKEQGITFYYLTIQ